MADYLCNPVAGEYLYQYNKDGRTGKVSIYRESADPSVIAYQGRYWMFGSMSLGVWVSDDLVHWESHRLPDELPLYDYAPDAKVVDDWVYLCASNKDHNCDFWRTRDILHGPYERFSGGFPFWDPDLFEDEDGRIYLYWGCSAITPIYGVELDKKTMQAKGNPVELIHSDAFHRGYERDGENNSVIPVSDEEIEKQYRAFLAQRHLDDSKVPALYKPMIKGMFAHRPYVEGAWMTKHEGRYYLQCAVTGTQYNVYADETFVSESPLGPYMPAASNPYSLMPGGFLTGAGHGSTFRDRYGNWWHAATSRISIHNDNERRIGIWPAGFDKNGNLFCNQRYGDWPIRVDGRRDPWTDPDWFLLSYHAKASATSQTADHPASNATDENIRTWWKAATGDPGQALTVDLGSVMRINAVQINFADDQIDRDIPGKVRQTSSGMARFIDGSKMVTRWKLETSRDGRSFSVLEDKSAAQTNLPHDLVVREEGIQARYVRLTALELPYGQAACASGLRVFGKADIPAPAIPEFDIHRDDPLDMSVTVHSANAAPSPSVGTADGYVISWGNAPDELYHSFLTFKAEQRITSLVEGQSYFVRVDAFNAGGITHGAVVHLD